MVLNEIQRGVPQGFDWHQESQAERTGLFDDIPAVPALLAEAHKAEFQVGSLGGGNHFVELQVDPDGIVWAMIHTGSRNVGKQIAEHFDRVARDLNRAAGFAVPLEWGLASMECGSEPGRAYLAAMEWCMRFAKESRRLIAEVVQTALDRRFPGVRPADAVDVHHNYAALERHYGEEVVVHRKGAVRAVGPVLVPGSMGTVSYVGQGRASAESFESCSHGAGRAMGRKAAMRALPREQVMAELEELDIRLFKRHKRDVAEEAPQAYKNIDDVMAWQRDLVDARIRLRPLGVVKG
jgi:tRNA-splicing ligase RtcB